MVDYYLRLADNSMVVEVQICGKMDLFGTVIVFM